MINSCILLITLDTKPPPGLPRRQVVFCRLCPLQLKLYNYFLNSKPVKLLLASTAPGERGAAAGAAGAASGGAGARSGRGSKSGRGGAAESGGAAKAPRPPKEETLAPLAAITALKKLCCRERRDP